MPAATKCNNLSGQLLEYYGQTRHHEVTMLGAPPQNLLSFGVGGKMNGSPKEEVTPIQSAIGSFVPSVLQF
jgi:hypothetical protein